MQTVLRLCPLSTPSADSESRFPLFLVGECCAAHDRAPGICSLLRSALHAYVSHRSTVNPHWTTSPRNFGRPWLRPGGSHR